MLFPESNMKLKEIFVLIYATIIVLLVLLGGFSVLAYRNFIKLKQSDELQYRSIAIANELKESSDLLTKFCQTYVVTGDPVWESYYHDVLDIRNGIKPRSNGRTIALRDSMASLGFTEEEFSLLKQAEEKSNQLVHTERVAFHAMKGLYEDKQGRFSIRRDPDTAFARVIVFDDAYRNYKREIMEPIGNFISAIEKRTKGQVDHYQAKGIWIMGSIIALIALVSSISIISFFIIKNRMIRQMNVMKETEKLLRETNATKDKLLSIIAHDLRSPFNGILGASELLMENLREYSLPGEAEGFLQIINASSINALTLLDNLLNWAKSQTGLITVNREKIKVSSVIREVLHVSDSRSRLKNIRLVYHPQADIEVNTDKNLLEIVLLNLVSNAIKFTNVHGEVTVGVNRLPGCIEISVADNGIGIEEEALEKIFDSNSQFTSRGTADEKGSGIGLILCKEFVELLGGRIWVESEIDKGSNFIFTLPDLAS